MQFAKVTRSARTTTTKKTSKSSKPKAEIFLHANGRFMFSKHIIDKLGFNAETQRIIIAFPEPEDEIQQVGLFITEATIQAEGIKVIKLNPKSVILHKSIVQNIHEVYECGTTDVEQYQEVDGITVIQNGLPVVENVVETKNTLGFSLGDSLIIDGFEGFYLNLVGELEPLKCRVYA